MTACDLTAGEQATWREGDDGCHLRVEEAPPDSEVEVEKVRGDGLFGLFPHTSGYPKSNSLPLRQLLLVTNMNASK
jgi:hypothetical protein